jgi:glycosyltransferase involved in cell wall biosynthesis
MSKRICIDGHNLALQHGTGVATYARNLANSLSASGHDVSTIYGAQISDKLPELLKEVLFFDYLGGASQKKNALDIAVQYVRELMRSPFGARAYPISPTGRVEKRRFEYRLPDASSIFNSGNLFNVARAYFKRHNKFLEVKFDDPPDIMHWTYPLPIRVAGIPNIYTIHDLVPLKLPYTTLDNKKYYYRLVKRCLETADRICTVSERSKLDIEEFFNVAPGHVRNTYQFVEIPRALSSRAKGEVHAEVKGVFGLEPENYFLFFGAVEPKKNVGRLIEAYLSTNVDAKLVVAGTLAWKADEELKLYASLLKRNPKLASRIQFVGYTSFPFLVSLIRGAKAVVFPSLYEGFGLPVLEAMLLGVPTICSSEGSLPEIAGDASCYVDPYDVGSIASALVKLDGDRDLRERLASQGMIQAARFNASAYRQVLNELYQFD